MLLPTLLALRWDSTSICLMDLTGTNIKLEQGTLVDTPILSTSLWLDTPQLV